MGIDQQTRKVCHEDASEAYGMNNATAVMQICKPG